MKTKRLLYALLLISVGVLVASCCHKDDPRLSDYPNPLSGTMWLGSNGICVLFLDNERYETLAFYEGADWAHTRGTYRVSRSALIFTRELTDPREIADNGGSSYSERATIEWAEARVLSFAFTTSGFPRYKPLDTGVAIFRDIRPVRTGD